jgi:hypothetical protein
MKLIITENSILKIARNYAISELKIDPDLVGSAKPKYEYGDERDRFTGVEVDIIEA